MLLPNTKTKMCAHITCLCTPRDGDEYCGEICRAAGRDNVEIACQCDHLACPCVAVLALSEIRSVTTRFRTVYEKDLGLETVKIAGSMTEYDPDSSWHAAEQYQEEFQ